jgi:hypothetical protein
MTAELNFVRQQGLRDATPQSCVYQYPALMWQPRAIGVGRRSSGTDLRPLCPGSYMFLFVTGQAGFAKRTLPWARDG